MYFEEEAEFLGSDFIDNLKYFFSMSYDLFQSSDPSRIKQEQEGKHFLLKPASEEEAKLRTQYNSSNIIFIINNNSTFTKRMFIIRVWHYEEQPKREW